MLHTRRALLLLTLLALLIGHTPTAPTKAASQKLSTINAPGGMISRAQASPDGARVIYLAGYDRLFESDSYVNGRADLYSAPAGGGLVINLSETIASRRSVLDFAISPDSQYVVFTVENAKQQIELYSVAVLGGQPVQLTAPFLLEILGQGPLSYEISPDSSTVVYLAEQETTDQRELYALPITGGPRTKLNPALPTQPGQFSGTVVSFKLSPTGTHVVYSASQDDLRLRELYSVAITGGGTTKLNAPINEGQDIAQFMISPTGEQVAYSTEPFFAAQIFSVPISGGAAAPIDTLNSEQFAFTPDGSRLVYQGYKNGRSSLFHVASTGGTSVTLTTSLLPRTPAGFFVDPTSRYIVYAVSDNNTSLISYDLTQNLALTLASDLGSINNNSLSISPNGAKVIYGDATGQIFSVPIGGGPAQALINSAIVNASSSFQIAADSDRLVYVTSPFSPDLTQIYSLPLEGGPTTQLTNDLGPEVEALFLLGLGAGGRLFYATSQRYDGSTGFSNTSDRLYSVPIDGTGAATLIDRSRTRVGDVQPGYQVSSDGAYVVYRADSERDEVYELYSVALPASVPVRLNADLPSQGDVGEFVISPDSTMVAYSIYTNQGTILSIIPIGGGAATTLLTIDSPNDGIGALTFTNQSDRLVYVKSNGISFTRELYSISVVGGAQTLLSSSVQDFTLSSDQVIYTQPVGTYNSPPTDLFRISVAGGQPTTLVGNNIGIIDFQVSADGEQVLYRSAAQFDTPQQPVTLASVPVNGGAGVELRTTTSGERFIEVVLSGDSQRVIYTIYTEDLNSSSYRLYSQLITDGTTNELIDTNVGADLSFEVAPTSDRIVYIDNAGPDPAVRAKLVSTDMTGSISNTIFVDTERLGGIGFNITPDGKQVAFTSNDELYSIPITGTAALKLTAKATDGSINTYRLSPASDRATFITKLSGSVVSDLFSVALSGGPVSQVSELPAADRAIEDYSFTPDGLLLYRADQAQGDVLDLFIADDAEAQPVFTTTSLTITEDSGTLNIPVQLSGPASIPLSFSVAQVGGNAIAGLDYTLSTPTLSFAAGTTTQTVTLISIDRAGYSGARTLVLGLVPSGPALATSEPVTTITITISDNDDPFAPSPTPTPQPTSTPTQTPQPTQPPAQRSLYLPLLRR